MLVGVLVALLLIQLRANALGAGGGGQQKMVQEFEPLPSMWHTRAEFLFPGFGLAIVVIWEVN